MTLRVALRFSLIVLALLIVAVAAHSAPARTKASASAFLDYRADSVGQLVNDLKANPKVADRLAKHFGMSRDIMITYFSENLVLTTVQTPRKMTTWYVSKSGRVYSKERLLSKGARVFSTRDGDMVLDWRCGNPLTRVLPAQMESKVPVTKVTPAEPAVKVAPAPPEELIVIPPPVSAVPPLVFTPVADAAVTSAIQIAPAAPSFLSPGLIAAVPALFGAVHVNKTKPSPPVVPEPTSLAALAMGVSGLAFGYRNRFKRH